MIKMIQYFFAVGFLIVFLLLVQAGRAQAQSPPAGSLWDYGMQYPIPVPPDPYPDTVVPGVPASASFSPSCGCSLQIVDHLRNRPGASIGRWRVYPIEIPLNVTAQSIGLGSSGCRFLPSTVIPHQSSL